MLFRSTGTTFGNIIPNIPYYVTGIASANSINVSTWPGGPNTVLTTSSGTMVASGFVPPINPQIVIGSSQAGVTINITGTTTGTNLISCVSTTGLVTNQPIVFSASIGNLIAGTTYYVVSGFGASSFQVSATQGGTVFSLLTGSGTLTDRKSTRLNSSHTDISRMPSSA